ncbi:glycosyltransferase, partial [Patescibacteria group bacterium]
LRFVGTAFGPEKELVEQEDIPFSSIVAPKLRRYFSWRHLLLPFELAISIVQAFITLQRWKPDVIVSAGGFVSVPLVWVGKLLSVPAVIHQQDLQPGLANKLMVPYAKKITVAFEDSLKHFPKGKAEWIGNPVRDLTPTTEEFSLDADYPIVFITGGGTGARALNNLVTADLCEFANVIHLTGKRKSSTPIDHPRYHQREFLGEAMKEAYAKADLVVARAGLGTISELAALGKPAIIIPMPGTHQEANADFLQEHGAAHILDQRSLTPETFTQEIQTLLGDEGKRQDYIKNVASLFPDNATEQFIAAINRIIS